MRIELTEDDRTREGVLLSANGDPGPFAAVDVDVFDREGSPVDAGFQLRVRDGDLDLPLGLARAFEPGERTWFLRAVRSDDCSAEVALDFRSSLPVRLELRPGAFLRVETTVAGRPTASRVRLLDTHGRTIVAFQSHGILAAFSSYALAPHRSSHGPLPPGRYQVEATDRGGTTKVVPLNLEAGTHVLVVPLD